MTTRTEISRAIDAATLAIRKDVQRATMQRGPDGAKGARLGWLALLAETVEADLGVEALNDLTSLIAVRPAQGGW